MEKVLVAIDGEHGAWEALSHACSLAKRLEVQINVLLVIPVTTGRQSQLEKERQDVVKKRLQLHIEQAKAEGIIINFFLTEGKYEDEVIRFANHKRITLVMHEAQQGDERSLQGESASLQSLRHRITCKVEVVAPKKNHS